MAKYYREYWDGVDSPPDVPIGPLKGGKIAKSSRAFAVHKGLDKVPALGRRIVFARSMAGSNAWQSGTVSGTVTRQIGAACVDLTPGCILAAGCLYLPSGSNTTGGAWGELVIDITWTDADGSQSVTQHIMPLEGQDDGSFDDDPWGSLRTKRINKIAPSSLVSITTMRDWSRYTNVDLTVSYQGNPRPVDFVIYERPFSLALEADDDGYWVSGISPEANPQSVTSPLQRLSETTPNGNPRMGTWMLMDQAKAQQEYMGPILFSWSGHNEESDSNTLTTDDYIGGAWTSANWYRIPDAHTNSDPTSLISNKGWGVSAGAYARPPRANSDAAMPNSGVVPVRVRAKITSDDVTLTSPFDFRIYTSAYSYIRISGTAPGFDSPQWFTAYGWLECGKGPGDGKSAVAVAQPTSGTNGLRVYDIQVYKAEKPSPAV